MNEAERPRNGSPQLRTLLLTDLCDSTALVERLGDRAAAELFREHDRLVLQLHRRWRGRLIDRSDGLLLLFDRPIEALGFAFDYRQGLRDLGGARGLALRVRTGLHVGEVLTWRNSEEAVRDGAKAMEVEGLAKLIAARLTAIARPDQILLSAVATPLARRAARELGERGDRLQWKSHGRWRLKGVPEPQEIFEVRESGDAPLRAPGGDAKARRDLPLWRRPPALAAAVALLALLVVAGRFAARTDPALDFAERDWVVLADPRNLTGEPVLDEALAQAFRISLEQSRHVNVLSDLKVRDTLRRMRRDPDGTPVDREVASEIAVREGARAVILPTVTRIGNRVRVSVEVVDPRTQGTALVEAKDGQGIDSVLASVDRVSTALRDRFGEGMQAIGRSSEPLPQVATASLEALRAYALGLKAYSRQRFDEALRHFRNAIEIDPEFALAHLGALRVHVTNVEFDLARRHLEHARAMQERLAHRDAMYLDAWLAELGDHGPQDAAEKWRILAEAYPDYHAGHANYGWSLFYLGHYEAALKTAMNAAVPQNPLRALAYELAGRVQLARGEYAQALESFAHAAPDTGDGAKRGSRQMAAAYAAMRRFDEAERVLAAIPGSEKSADIERISIAVDKGRASEALSLAERASARYANESPYWAGLFQAIELSVRALQPGGAPPAVRFEATIADLWSLLPEERQERGEVLCFAIASAYLAQRAGHAEVAARWLPRFAEAGAELGNPRIDQMLTVVAATQKRLAKDPAGAVGQLRKLVDGSELFQVHVALRDAHLAKGDTAAAEREREWLARNRGLAYAERVGSYVLQATNVADAANAQAGVGGGNPLAGRPALEGVASVGADPSGR